MAMPLPANRVIPALRARPGTGVTAASPLRRRLLLVAIVVANAALVGWLWLHQEAPEEVPAAMLMTPARIAATPDFALIHLTFSDLNMRVIANPANIPRWRSLPAAARHTLVVAWTEERFPGFVGVLLQRRSAPFHFQVDDLVQAYEAIGGGAAAEVVKEAGRLAQQPSAEGSGAWAELDARFADQRRRLEVQRLLRTYIRDHAEDIAAARIAP